MRLALDSSFIVKLFIEEEFSREVVDLMETARLRDIELIASELTLYEVGNAIWKKVRKRKVDARKYVAQLDMLDIEYVPPSTSLMTKAMGLAQKYGVTYYDATHVAVARDRKAMLVTEDRGILKKFEDTMRVRDMVDILNE